MLHLIVVAVAVAVTFAIWRPSSQQNDKNNIKTMKLYSNIKRIDRQLAHMGYKPDDRLTPEILAPIDSMHYLGDEAIQSALDILLPPNNNNNNNNPESSSSTSSFSSSSPKILDIGSGFGGPARYMATRGCDVVALEIQPDVSEKGSELTQRCDLPEGAAQVTHINGDIIKDAHANANATGASSWGRNDQYDMVTSWLVFLHITEKEKLYNKCHDVLKHGGRIFVEDFYKKNDFTKDESIILSRDIYCEGHTLHTREGYIQALEEAGFTDVTFVDMTTVWTTFVHSRFEAFVNNKESYVNIHGLDAYESLYHFYNAMRTLFKGNNLGGVRIYATNNK